MPSSFPRTSLLVAVLWACAPSGSDAPRIPTTPTSIPSPEDTGVPPTEPGPEAGEILTLDLVGRPLDGPPSFTPVRTVAADAPVHVAVDPIRSPQIVGKTCDVVVVTAKTAAAWEAAPTLDEIWGSPSTLTVDASGLAANIVEIVAPGVLPPGSTGIGYDVVLDCDRDGTLSPGDVLDGGGTDAGLYVVPDLSAPGPHAVTTTAHSAGPWLDQLTTYPTDIASLGQLPLVVVAHGFGHASSYYDHIGDHLASYGYVVTSIRNDVGSGAGAGTESAAETLFTNTDYLLGAQATVAGGILDGHLDASRIVWIGHSTGGECVVRAYTRLHDGEWTSDHFTADSIALVSSMAPVAFLSRGSSNPHDVNYHLVTGGADRDTANYPEDGYTQNLALFERATGNRHLTWIHGAGHGDLHNGPQNWLDRPEPAAPDPIGPEGAHPVVLGYQLALAEWYTRDNRAMIDFFERSSEDLRPAGIPDHVVLSTEYRPADAFVIEDVQSGAGTEVSSSGGEVVGDADHLEEIAMTDHDWSYAWTGNQPANGMTRNLDAADDARCLVFDWAPGEQRSLEFEVVADQRDLTDDTALMFRVAQGTRHPHTDALDAGLSFGITLRDEAGTTSTVDFGHYGHATRPYRRPGSGPGAGWANEFVTIRIPLVDFAVGTTLDLGAIEAVRLDLGGDLGAPQGRVAFDDLSIVP